MYNILLSQFNFDEPWCYEKIKSYLQQDARVTFLPLTFSSVIDTSEKWQVMYQAGSEYYTAMTQPFLAFGYDVSQFIWINPFEADKDTIGSILEKTDLLVLPGGLPDLQMKRMQELDIIDELHNFYGNVLGVSSGAMTQPSVYFLSPDSEYPKPQYHLNGIGMIDVNAQIEVHFNPENQLQIASLEHVLQFDNVITIGEEGCLIVEHNHIETIGDVRLFKKGGTLHDVI